MDCIPYINDLQTEINILTDIRNSLIEDRNMDANLIEKISQIENKIIQKSRLLDKCKENLSKISRNSIEYRMFLKMLDGKGASKIIEEIANENYINDISPSGTTQLWIHYKKMKKFLEP